MKKINIAVPILIMVIGTAISLLPNHESSAHNSGNLALESHRRGYFTNAWGPSSIPQGTVLSTGLLNRVISSSSVNTNAEYDALAYNTLGWWDFNLNSKSEFINYIKGKYNAYGCPSGTSNRRDCIGAAFIIQSMRGVSSVGTNAPWPTSANIADWEARINNPAITLRIDRIALETHNSSYMFPGNYSETQYTTTTCGINGIPWTDVMCTPGAPSGSGWINYSTYTASNGWERVRAWRRTISVPYSDGDDVMFYNDTTDLPAISFVHNTSGITYRLKINCANAIGDYGGLPQPANWQYALDINRSVTQVEPGQEVVISSSYFNPSGGVYPSGVAANNHVHEITPRSGTDGGRVTYVSSGSNTGAGSRAVDSDPDSMHWQNFGPMFAGTGADHTIRYRVDAGVAPGTRIWFRTIASPEYGSSPSTVDGWGGIGGNFFRDTYVDVVAPPAWEYRAQMFDDAARNTTNEGTMNAGGDQIHFWSAAHNPTSVAGTSNHDHTVSVSNHDARYSIDEILSPLDADPYGGSTYNVAGPISGPGNTSITWSGGAIGANSYTSNKRASYRIKSDAPHGAWFCLQASVDPSRGDNTGVILDSSPHLSEERCYTVYNERYDLSPPVISFGTNVVEPGATLNNLSLSLCNDEDELGLLDPSSGAVRGNSPNTRFWISSATNINGANLDSRVVIAPGDCNTVDLSGATVPSNLSVGDNVCLTVNAEFDYGFTNGSWHGGTRPQTAQECIVVGVQPYFHVTDGDVWAGAIFDSVLGAPRAYCGDNPAAVIRSVRSDLSGLWVGSFVEYAALATGEIDTFGTDNAANRNFLTFANTPDNGHYTTQTKCIPNYFGLLEPGSDSTITSNSRNINGFTANEQTLVVPGGAPGGTFTTSGNWNVNSSYTILIDGDLFINRDIQFGTNYGNAANLNIPSLVFVVNGDILIEDSVNQIDAILISHGEVWTCADNSGTQITEVAENVCSEPLTVNGAIITNRLNLMRTHEQSGLRTGGVHDSSSGPAEVINFLPEFYLSEPIFKSPYLSDDAFQTVQIKDLPPIY